MRLGGTMPGKTGLFWVTVQVAATILAINMGIRQTFGLFTVPVSGELGLGREVFSLSMAVLNLVWGAAAPFAGAYADKFGAKRVIFAGATAYVLGICLMAGAGGQAALIAAGVLIGLGIAGTGFTAVLGVVGRTAPPEHRQRALAITTMGSAIGQFVALPFVNLTMDAYGWVFSLFALAGVAALMAPLGLGLAAPASDTKADQQSLGGALAEAVGHKGFWLVTGGFFVCGFHIAFVAVHLPAFLADKGFPGHLAATALALVGLANIAGTYLWGRAAEVIERRQALTLLYFLRSLIFLGFLYLPLSQTSVLAFAVLLGFLWLGTVPLTSGLLVVFFGPRWLSMLYGIVFFSHQIGSFCGAWLGGYVYDNFKSYDMVWWVCVALGVFAAAMNWPIAERPAERLRAEARAY
jgi:predicted MFS family arabinose efflux permease